MIMIGLMIYLSIYTSTYIASLQGNYSEALPAQARPKKSLEEFIERTGNVSAAAENEDKRDDHSKQRDPQSRKPFSIWWQCEYVSPQSPPWMPSGEIGDQSRPKSG